MRSRIRPLAAAVAGLLVLSSPAALAREDGDGAARAGTFTALSYNVAGLPQVLSSEEPAEESPLISPLLNAYDLVLLQEDWVDALEDQRKEGLVGDEVERTGYHDLVVKDAEHPYQSVPAPPPAGTDLRRTVPPPEGTNPRRAVNEPPLAADGLNRLSNMRFDDVTRVMWDECYGGLSLEVAKAILEGQLDDAQPSIEDVLNDAGLGAVNDQFDGGAADCSAQKGFSVATTTLADGVTVDIYNLHAEAGSAEEDQEARAAGYAQLAAFILEHSEGRAIILGGDTNLHIDRDDRPDGGVWSSFLEVTGLTDACDALDCGADWAEIDKFAFRSGGGVALEPLRHDFARERFSRDGDGANPLSDHSPLVVTWHWRAIQGGPAAKA